MEYKTLGKTGIQVSGLCFGTMSFGGAADEEASAAMFHRCRELGVNFFDTANVYNEGRSEEILGRLMAGCRDELVLTSKVCLPTGTGVNDGLRYGDGQYYEIAERFTAYAHARELHPATLAVAWVMSHPAVTAPIIGARSVEQLEPSLAALDVPMTPEWRREISELSITPPPATDRSEELLK